MGLFRQWLEQEMRRGPNYYEPSDNPIFDQLRPKKNYGQEAGHYVYEGDTAPSLTPAGDYILYHGTTLKRAGKIMQQRKIEQSRGWGAGICTTRSAAAVYGSLHVHEDKSPSVVVKVVVDKNWLKQQVVQPEVGGSGRDQWIIKGTDIPPEAIKGMEILRH